jgi:hypothetical protein
MARSKEIRSYDYVNRPYEQVCAALRGDAAAVFRAATNAASERAHDVASALRVRLAGLEIQKEVVIETGAVAEQRSPALDTMVTSIELKWAAADAPRLFPLMQATLSVYALTAAETQLDLLGRYRPPLGALGKAIDAIVGHRIAEACVHHFLADVASFLRRSLPERR